MARPPGSLTLLGLATDIAPRPKDARKSRQNHRRLGQLHQCGSSVVAEPVKPRLAPSPIARAQVLDGSDLNPGRHYRLHAAHNIRRPLGSHVSQSDDARPSHEQVHMLEVPRDFLVPLGPGV